MLAAPNHSMCCAGIALGSGKCLFSAAFPGVHSALQILRLSAGSCRYRPDQIWVQCEECLKWRRLPDRTDLTSFPEQWFCHLHPLHKYR